MLMSTTSSGGAGKTCVVCGEDVSRKPRTKDSHGRYYCQPCYDNAIAEKHAKRASAPLPKVRPGPAANIPRVPRAPSLPRLDDPVDDGPNIFDQLITAPPVQGGRLCPGCNQPLPNDAVICMQCGYNLQTGQRLAVEQVTAKKPGALSGSDATGLLTNPVAISLALLAGFGVFAALSWGDPNLTVGYIIANALFSLAVGILVLIAAFRESIGQGFLTLCVPCYALYFVYGVCDSKWIRALFGVSIATQVLGFMLQMQVRDELNDMGLGSGF
jgi:hypothetical protein